MIKAEPYLALVIEAIGRARQSVPWPSRVTLPDGNTQYSGLTENEVNEHFARAVLRELAMVNLPDGLVQEAARAVFRAESEALGEVGDDSHFAASQSSYRAAAVIGFRSVLAEFLKRGVR